MTNDQLGENTETDETVEVASEERPQYGVGPFSIREVALVGIWLAAFVVSFFSVASQQAMAQLLFGGSVWTNGLDWILTIAVPTVAVFLIVLRRFSPDGIRRVGSLGIDQFASVAFSVSAVVWLTLLWRNVAVVVESSVWIYGWVVWVEFFLMLAGVALTVFGPLIPVICEDFKERREIVAHRNARPIRRVSPRPPRPAKPVAPQQTDEGPAAVPAGVYGAPAYGQAPYGEAPYGESPYGSPYAEPVYTDVAAPQPAVAEPLAEQDAWAPVQSRGTFEPVDAAADTTVYDTQSAQQAFWALAPEEREVVDDRGLPIFRIGPTAWALVLEDRGGVFVVRHEDGRIGYLHEVSGVTRG